MSDVRKSCMGCIDYEPNTFSCRLGNETGKYPGTRCIDYVAKEERYKDYNHEEYMKEKGIAM